MTLVEIILTSIGLAMDAFAVSICKGLSMKKLSIKKMIIIGLYFGIFQLLMPVFGYLLASKFTNIVNSFDHWIAFVLLFIIGINMIRDNDDNADNKSDDISIRNMIILAVATSIDALAVGITFAFLEVNLIESVTIIGLITFIISMIGVFIGNKFGNKLQNKANLFGGIILILIGLKILLQHLGVL